MVLSFALVVSNVETDSDYSSILRYEVNNAFLGRLKHSININNPTPYRVSQGELFVPLIRNETARHYVVLGNISSPVGSPTLLNDDSENTYAYWSDIEIQAKKSLTIEITYDVFSFATRYIINSALLTDYNTSSSLYKKYTQPEELIESDDIRIVWKAKNLTINESNIHKKVAKIYDFAILHLHYAVQDDERGALWALEEEVGDCSEYSYLFVALCRAAGIPARVQAGFAFLSVGEALEDGHMWAEYYLEEYGWIPVDATWRLFDQIGYRHFSSIQSIPMIPYTNFLFNYTTGTRQIEESQTVSLEYSSNNAFGSSFFTEYVVKTVQKTSQAKLVLFIAKILGATTLFSTDAAEAEETLRLSRIELQNGIESWSVDQNTAQSKVADSLVKAEEALGNALMLVAKALILLIVTISAILVFFCLILRRRIKRHEKTCAQKPSYCSNHLDN